MSFGAQFRAEIRIWRTKTVVKVVNVVAIKLACCLPSGLIGARIITKILLVYRHAVSLCSKIKADRPILTSLLALHWLPRLYLNRDRTNKTLTGPLSWLSRNWHKVKDIYSVRKVQHSRLLEHFGLNVAYLSWVDLVAGVQDKLQMRNWMIALFL